MEGEGPFPFANPEEAVAGGVLAEVARVPYTGDATSDRDIDMGTRCHLVLIYMASSYSGSNDHFALGYADGAVYGVFINAAATKTEHSSMAQADPYFQGIQAGTDNVRLGNSGGSSYGPNVGAVEYVARGFRFSE